MRHIEAMAEVMLGTGLIVAYGYCMEAFMAWYSANTYERFMYSNRMLGPYGLELLAADRCATSDPAIAVEPRGFA